MSESVVAPAPPPPPALPAARTRPPRRTTWAPCPRCGGARVVRRTVFTTGGVLVFAGGCLVWIPILGWIAAPFLLLAGVAMLCAAPFTRGPRWRWWRCKDCGQRWREDRREVVAAQYGRA